MSHLVETMFYVGATPWHGLGEKIDGDPNAAEAMKAASLDWRVKVQPLSTPAFQTGAAMVHPWTGATLDAGGSFADPELGNREPVDFGGVVRRESDGAMLGLVGSRWTPVQNSEAFGFFDPLVKDGLARYHTAGSLKGGRLVWVLAQVGNEATISGDDRVGNFLLLSMGHDGTRGVQICPTPIRVVCANTLAAADGRGAKVMTTIQHTASASRRLADLSGFLKPYADNFENLTELFQTMALRDINNEQAGKVVKALFPDPVRDDGTAASATKVRNIRDGIYRRFEGRLIGAEALPAERRRTAWTLYNAVTEYTDHERGRTADSRVNAAWFGAGRDLKTRALVAIKDAVGIGQEA